VRGRSVTLEIKSPVVAEGRNPVTNSHIHEQMDENSPRPHSHLRGRNTERTERMIARMRKFLEERAGGEDREAEDNSD
jgi:hypothetical protein